MNVVELSAEMFLWVEVVDTVACYLCHPAAKASDCSWSCLAETTGCRDQGTIGT